jgi:hypothetical protein
MTDSYYDLEYCQEDISAQPPTAIMKEFDRLWSEVVYAVEGTQRGSIENRKIVNNYASRLEGCIFDRTGIRIVLRPVVSPGSPCFIQPIWLNKKNVISPARMKGIKQDVDIMKMVSDLNGEVGEVDTKTGRVSGAFSRYASNLYIDVDSLVNIYGLTFREVSAVVMHEIGHAFTICQFSDRTHSTNQIIAGMAVRMQRDPNLTGDKYDVTIREATDIGLLTKGEANKLLTAANRQALGTVLGKKLIAQTQSMLLNGEYDNTSAEALADDYAAKFGYYREIASANFKLGTRQVSGTSLSQSSSMGIILTPPVFVIIVLALIMILQTPVGLPLVLVGIGIWIFGTSLLFLLFAFIAIGMMIILIRGEKSNREANTPIEKIAAFGISGDSPEYDDLLPRLIRIRNSAVADLKSPELDQEAVKYMLESIENIDELIDIAGKGEKILSPFSSLYDYIVCDEDKDPVLSQRRLEKLINNELTVSAAKLSNM